MDFSIKEITYSEIHPIWEKLLWPQRVDPIRPLSSMILGEGYNMNIYKEAQPLFLGLFQQDTLVGVLSGHSTLDKAYRIRGLYILPEFRGHGGAQKLFKAFKDHAIKSGHEILWSYPKLEALKVYLKFGFVKHPSQSHDENHVYVFLNTVT